MLAWYMNVSNGFGFSIAGVTYNVGINDTGRGGSRAHDVKNTLDITKGNKVN